MIWIEIIINGLFLGGLYALVGLGLGFTFGVMRVVNISQGDFIVAAAFIGLFLYPWTPVHPLLVILPVAAIAFCIGMLLQRLIINRVLGSDQIPQILVTFGLAIIMRNATGRSFRFAPSVTAPWFFMISVSEQRTSARIDSGSSFVPGVP